MVSQAQRSFCDKPTGGWSDKRTGRVYGFQSDAQREIQAAALDFIAKVERGEVRSRRSYAAFRAALDGGRQDDDGR